MPGEELAVDGRRARRQRGRAAVTDAMIDLVFEGHIPPTVEQVAERSGVSVASIFRYFETLDDLRRATTDLYFERYVEKHDIPEIGCGDLPSRAGVFTAARVDLYETSEPMARLVRLRAGQYTKVDELLHRVRATRADQVGQHFAPELGAMTKTVRDNTVCLVATLTSFESWDQARHDHRRSPLQIRRAWADAITKLLSP